MSNNVRVRRHKCACGRYVATAQDWTDDNIQVGERDDLCWGPEANCTAADAEVWRLRNENDRLRAQLEDIP